MNTSSLPPLEVKAGESIERGIVEFLAERLRVANIEQVYAVGGVQLFISSNGVVSIHAHKHDDRFRALVGIGDTIEAALADFDRTAPKRGSLIESKREQVAQLLAEISALESDVNKEAA